MRCKHNKIAIIEYATAFTTHIFDGENWSHYSDYGDYEGTVEVNCYDCGHNKIYYRKNKPKWLIKRLEELNL